MCLAPQRRAIFRPFFDIRASKKMARTPQVFTILTWQCASRHSGVQSLDIQSSKSGPPPRCFVHFDLKMRFSPQRRAIFRHQNFKKRSATEVFCIFWLENAHRATAACYFWTSELQKVSRRWGVLYSLTWKCASRYSRVQFFMCPLNGDLRTRRFNEPTFRPSRHTNHWKNTAFPDFPNISRLLIFFLLTFAQLDLFLSLLLCSAFQLSILSEVRLLNFLR